MRQEIEYGGSRAGVARRLAIEKKLLLEEKYYVEALREVKTEIHALQIERMNFISLREQIIRIGRIPVVPPKEQPPTQPVQPASQSLAAEFNLLNFDYVNSNNVELDLTVPTHQFYNPTTVQDFGEMDACEEFDPVDDYEIEMSMLINDNNDIVEI